MNFSLPSKNVKLIFSGLVLMIAGYVLMIGGGSSDPNVFNPEMFNARRLVISPLLVIAGIVVIIYAIMHTPGGEGKK
ncbi:MAG: DUF3098 domain-containing protein [Bacteroidales bacterium]|nr:DUF3098 domain-containing protein [Candidatus Cacconaster caballi]